MRRQPSRPSVLLAVFLAVLLALSPLAASAGEVGKLVDPDTSGRWEELFGSGSGSYSTAQAGRIWADKSVYATADEARAAGLPVKLDVPDHGFFVGLSALSSAASVRQEGGPAHDVVFVVSTNRLLTDMTYGGRPQGAYLADALNSAIARLMAENDGDGATTRVGVIGYDSQVVTMMPLAAYEPDAEGRFVSFTGSSLEVVATAADGSSTAAATLGSGSYLQRAVSVAGDELEAAAGDAGSEERLPVLCVMGRSIPSMANVAFSDPPAYTGSADGFLGPLPGSRENGYGTDAMLATMLTMRDVVSRVDAAWGADRELTFFSTGLDTSDAAAYLLETAHEQAHHPLVTSGVNLSDNLAAAARTFEDASARGEKDVTLALYGSGSYGIVPEDVTFPTAAGLLDAGDPAQLSVVDDYLSAHSASALSWAFGTVVDRSLGIVYTAPASGGPGDERPGGSRVTVSDPVGAGMEVSRVSGIVYGNRLLDGALAAQAVKISLEDPGDIEATHEFDYLVEAMNSRYDLGYAAYDLFYDALRDGQFSYTDDATFSNHASWYVNPEHEMVPIDGRPYAFATQAEVDAAADGDWRERAPEDVRAKIEAAQAAGATAACETYFYIGNLPNQYTGGDVTLYDFVVMVETDLSSGRQTLLLSVPVEAVPARRVDVSVAADGSATIALDGGEDVSPLRFAYEVSPTPDVKALLERMDAGELVSDEELSAATGAPVSAGADGRRLLYASAFSGSGDGAEAGAVASAWAAQTNSYYAFSRDTPLYVRSASGYEPLTSLPEPGGTYYFQRTVYSASLPSADATAPASVEQSWEPYVVALDADQIGARFVVRDGQCVALAGTPRYVRPVELGTLEKDPNATGSVPYVERLGVTDVEGGGVRLASRLGNNGVLVLPAGTEEPPVVDPSPDPDPTPDPDPNPEPTPDPDPTPDPEPDPDPEPEPEPTPNPDPAPDQTPDPEPSPGQDQAPGDEPADESGGSGVTDNKPTGSAQDTATESPALPNAGDDSLVTGVLLAMTGVGIALVAYAVFVSRRRP